MDSEKLRCACGEPGQVQNPWKADATMPCPVCVDDQPAEKAVVGYMDKVDFDFELGDASGGNRIYPSVDNLKRNSKCWEECGIVEVEVRLRSVVVPGTV